MQVPYYTAVGFTVREQLHFTYTNKLVQSLKKLLLRGKNKTPSPCIYRKWNPSVLFNFLLHAPQRKIRNQCLNNKNML